MQAKTISRRCIPDIAAQWDEEKKRRAPSKQCHRGLEPPRVVAMRKKGHSYRAVIAQRVQRGDGCPYCANRKVLPGFNDLATVQPLVAKQWHETLNGADTGDGDRGKSQKRRGGSALTGMSGRLPSIQEPAQKMRLPVCAGKTPSAKR